jgi:hypothetical protein
MLHTVNVEGIEALGHCILAVVVPPAKGIDRPAPFPATLPTLTVPAVSAPCRAFPLTSVNRLFAASHASADVAMYAGFAARTAASGSAGAVYVPAVHTHAFILEAPAGEVVPVGHEAHKLFGILVYNAVISSCVNTLLYIRISAICPAYPRPPSALFPIVKSLKFGNVCPAAPVPVALCVPSIYNIADTEVVPDNV